MEMWIEASETARSLGFDMVFRGVFCKRELMIDVGFVSVRTGVLR